MPVWMAITAATASTAPAAPSKCPARARVRASLATLSLADAPIMLFVLLMRTCEPGSVARMARYSARSPAGVLVPCAFT